MGHAIADLILAVLKLLWLAVFVQAALSWLVAFNVINSRNQFVYQVVRMLDAVVNPLLRPFRRVIPPLGGVDITPIILVLALSFIIEAIQFSLKPYLINVLG
ncbi:MAG: hypothetical protein JWM33_2068 [Caulobacteraceae bacterium]|nr:hypothetical protein [Caulobacteraceae bacterium]